MKIKFLSPVNAGTEVYAVGDTADLPHAQAKELIVCGAAEQYDPVAAKAMAMAKAKAEAEAIADKLAQSKAADKAEADLQALAEQQPAA